MIALMRLILALSALVIIVLVPSEPDRHVLMTYATLCLYALYSAAVYWLVLQRPAGASARLFADWGHWIDIGWYTVLIALSSGTSSIFVVGYFFPVLVASFHAGFREGIRVVVCAVVLFIVVAYATAATGEEFELRRFLIRPVFLAVLGYMIAYWGGSVTRLVGRLELLRDVTRLPSPRFGADQLVGRMMHRLLRLYDADACALVMTEADASKEATLRRISRRDPEGAARAEAIPRELAALLLGTPADRAMVYPGVEGKGSDPLAATLDAASFIAVPFDFAGRLWGRLYLTFGVMRRFSELDGSFLRQVLDQTLPLMDNIRLVGQLAARAAEEERHRIARDIHDGVIQPYIGLRIGLAALRQKLDAKKYDLKDIERLMEMTDMGIEDLRRQVSSMKEAGGSEGGLVPALQRFASRFSETTGIEVAIAAQAPVAMDDRLAAEVFQMVTEGLSNVRRHTQAARIDVGLSCRDGHLLLRIENDSAGSTDQTPFTPRSIAERATMLGGRTSVDRRADGGAVVSVELPL
jgi:signal transduction histidine kinase